jgi:hypothetical protein
MASGTGELDLLFAIRQVQLANTELASAGVFTVSAPREDALPYFLNAVYKPSTGRKRLTGRDSSRYLIIEMKAVAAEASGREAVEIANDLADLNYDLFAGDGAEQRLNTVLEPLGWSADMPLENGAIGPYKDNLDDLERWHVGHKFLFNMKRIPST